MDRMAPRVVRIRLVPESSVVRPYRAGQFLFIRFDIPGLQHKEHPFTIANPPGGSFIEILVKGTDVWTLALYDQAENFPKTQSSQHGSEQPGAGKTWLAVLDYPYGSFTTKDADGGPWVFLAEGIGITPFLAMAGGRLRDDARILILWAAYNRDELAGIEELSAINARRPSIRLVPALGHDPMWTGRRGQLDRQSLLDLAGREIADPRTCYWICCPTPLRIVLVKALKSLGIHRKHIRYEDCSS